MKEQKSAGIVLFRNASNKNEFLLLNYPQGHWDFVKGKVEEGETPHETALRETKEETGISDIEFIDGFEESVEYNFRFENKDIHKKVTFFLAKTNEKKISISHEHNDFVWLEYDDALKKTTFRNAKNVLSKTNEFLSSTI
uniref:Bis(5'-nucleosyl)-tetraphosphatase [asymmetrical] n=1 Tax=uncultured marine thaumarchaeote KM3_70_D05 TaxID=1456251 RepID=A0A075HNC5_9ARCH|nr:NUDIX hydrolase [uncultured marine thaumarchaeote KM3_70_D05]